MARATSTSVESTQASAAGRPGWYGSGTADEGRDTAMREDLYCKAYAAGAPDATALTTIIADASNAEANGRTVKTAGLDVDVFSLGRHGSADLGGEVDLWPYELDAFAAEGVKQPGFVAALAQRSNTRQRGGLRVVASCNFESDLAAAR